MSSTTAAAIQLEGYGICVSCSKPFEEIMGSCRACGTERLKINETRLL